MDRELHISVTIDDTTKRIYFMEDSSSGAEYDATTIDEMAARFRDYLCYYFDEPTEEKPV